MGFISIRLSASGYVAALKAFHGSKVKHGLNYQQGLAELNKIKKGIENISRGIKLSNQISQLRNNQDAINTYYDDIETGYENEDMTQTNYYGENERD